VNSSDLAIFDVIIERARQRSGLSERAFNRNLALGESSLALHEIERALWDQASEDVAADDYTGYTRRASELRAAIEPGIARLIAVVQEYGREDDPFEPIPEGARPALPPTASPTELVRRRVGRSVADRLDELEQHVSNLLVRHPFGKR
jgi:hypothetical protein